MSGKQILERVSLENANLKVSIYPGKFRKSCAFLGQGTHSEKNLRGSSNFTSGTFPSGSER